MVYQKNFTDYFSRLPDVFSYCSDDTVIKLYLSTIQSDQDFVDLSKNLISLLRPFHKDAFIDQLDQIPFPNGDELNLLKTKVEEITRRRQISLPDKVVKSLDSIEIKPVQPEIGAISYQALSDFVLDKCIPLMQKGDLCPSTEGSLSIQTSPKINFVASHAASTLLKGLSEIGEKTLEESFRFMKRCEGKDPFIVRQTILSHLEKGVSWPLLISIRISDHAMLCQITKDRIYYYNSGYGLNYHASLEGRFQTFLEVPFKESELENVVDQLVEWAVHPPSSIDSIYTYLKGLGDPVAADPIYYELSQLRDTCKSQCMMAFLRHFILSQALGSPSHRMGVYKHFKARLFHQLLKDYSGDSKELGERKEEFRLELELFEKAEKNYERYYEMRKGISPRDKAAEEHLKNLFKQLTPQQQLDFKTHQYKRWPSKWHSVITSF